MRVGKNFVQIHHFLDFKSLNWFWIFVNLLNEGPSFGVFIDGPPNGLMLEVERNQIRSVLIDSRENIQRWVFSWPPLSPFPPFLPFPSLSFLSTLLLLFFFRFSSTATNVIPVNNAAEAEAQAVSHIGRSRDKQLAIARFPFQSDSASELTTETSSSEETFDSARANEIVDSLYNSLSKHGILIVLSMFSTEVEAPNNASIDDVDISDGKIPHLHPTVRLSGVCMAKVKIEENMEEGEIKESWQNNALLELGGGDFQNLVKDLY